MAGERPSVPTPGVTESGPASNEADDDISTAVPTKANWPLWFVMIGSIIGLAYVFAMPVSRPLDEPAHLARVATFDRGVLVPPSFGATNPRYVIDGCTAALLQEVTSNFSALIDHRSTHRSTMDRWRMHFVNPPCRGEVRLTGGATISNAEINSPVPYVPAMIGWALGRSTGGALGAVYGARLAQLAAYLAICWWALRRLPWGKPFAATVALVPTALAGAAGVSADPVTLALTFAAVSTTLAIISRVEQRGERPMGTSRLWGLSALLVLLGLCKPAATPLVLLALVVPAAAFRSTRHRLGWIVATGAAVAATGGAWAALVSSKVHITTTPHVDSTVTGAWLNQHLWVLPTALWRTIEIPAASRYILGGVVTPLGLDVLEVPVITTLIGLGLMVAARLVDPLPRRATRYGTGRIESGLRTPRRQLRVERLTAVVIAILGAAAVSYGIYLASNRPDSLVISGIQGRYFLPYLLLLLMGIRPTRAGTARVGFHAAVAVGLVAINVAWIARLMVWWKLV